MVMIWVNSVYQYLLSFSSKLPYGKRVCAASCGCIAFFKYYGMHLRELRPSLLDLEPHNFPLIFSLSLTDVKLNLK